jgi:subtilisin family serine protease
MSRYFIPLSVLCVLLFPAFHSYSSVQFIIELDQNYEESVDQLQLDLEQDQIDLVEALFEELGLYLVRSQAPYEVATVKEALRNHYAIKQVYSDEPMKLRNRPNDKDFSSLWSLENKTLAGADIKALDAWKIGTGGKTRDREPLAVAIIDSGFDLNHEDLKDNIWVNKNEIPGNGKDDDQNGYIDDINGWNAYKNSGAITASRHGTHVAGIIGAKGNNKKQVVGVNWDIQMQLIQGSSSSTSTVLKAYNYVLKNKKLWISSQGEKGANIVATNSSFGIDRRNCQSGDYKLWNEVYTKLGEAGVLSVAATANQGYDVDSVGDVPTGCNTPYIVAVTNTTIKDERNSRAAWGEKAIDLGAPGTSILSTVPGNNLSKLTGTSMATPHVVGAIALMFSVASQDFLDFYRSQPGKASLVLKDLLLKSVDPLESLEGKTVSGGRLNLAKSLTSIASYSTL